MRVLSKFKSMGLTLFSMCLISLMLFSCGSNDNSTTPGQAAEGVITAKVGGVAVTTLSMVIFASKVQNNLHIQGNTGGTSAEAFTFIVLNFNGAGTYPIGGGANISNSASYMKTQVDLSNPANSKTETWQAPYDNTKAGEVTISEINDSEVKGTFYFKAQNVNGDKSIKNIESGSFNVKFTK